MDSMNFRLSRVLLALALTVTPATAADPVLLDDTGPETTSGALQCRHLPSLMQLYLKAHYAHHELDEHVKKDAVEQFIKTIDPSKTLLLEPEVVKLRTDLMQVFAGMRSGECAALDTAYKLVLARVEEDEKYAKEVLAAKDFKVDQDVELVLDADARGYAKTPDERRETLRKLIHFQIGNAMLAKITLSDATKQQIHRYELVTRRFRERLQKNEMATLFAQSFASGLDPHTAFLAKNDLEDFQIQLRLALEGIGAQLSSKEGYTVIEELVPGGSADKMNVLRPKDKIIAVAQEGQKPVPVIDMDLREVVRMIRGPKGTKVTLTILRQGEKNFETTIVRDKIDVRDQAAKITYETRTAGGKTFKIGVIDLPAFYGSEQREGRLSSRDVRAALEEGKRNGVQGIVMNLSRNGGGLLEEAVRISGLFLKRGAVVATQSSEGKRRVLEDQDDEVVWNGPLLVMTSRMSASASEILAGALRDYKRALIVGGDHTFGKGTVQVLFPIPGDLGAVKITTGMFFLPGGVSTQRVGVKSDMQVPSTFNDPRIGEEKLDEALPPQVIPAFVSSDVNTTDAKGHWTPVEDALIPQLAERSKARVAKNEEMQKTLKELAESRRTEKVKLSELLAKAKKDDEQKSVKQRLKDLEGPFLEESVTIMADWLSMGKK